jgi:hypothetical protein
MFLAKMKIGFAVVLALGLVGAGAGGWAYRSSLAAQVPDKGAEKASPQKPEKEKQQDVERLKEQLAERARKLLQARDALDRSEQELNDFEQRDAEERANLRMRLLEMEERLNAMRGEHRMRQVAELEDLGREKNKRDALQHEWRTWIEKARKPEENPSFKELQVEIMKQEDVVKDMESRFNAANRKRTEAVIEFRREMYLAEEKLERHDRLAAIRRKRIMDAMETASDRLRNLQNDDRPSDPSNRNLREVIRKVDDLQREVTELRREMRRSPSERDK